MSNLGDVLSKLVYSNVSQKGVWGRSPQPPVAMVVWGQSPQPLSDFCIFGKKAILIPLHHISHVFTAIWKNWIFNIESQSKIFDCSFLFLLAIKLQNTFKISHYGVKF